MMKWFNQQVAKMILDAKDASWNGDLDKEVGN